MSALITLAKRILLAVLAGLGCILLISCVALIAWAITRPGPNVQQIKSGYPFKWVTLRGENESFFVHAAEGTKISDFYDMNLFDGFHPGMTAGQAVDLHGEPAYRRMEYLGQDRVYGFIKDDVAIEVICRKEYPSDGDVFRLQWFVRAKPLTPLSLLGLSPSVMELLPANLPQTRIGISSGEDLLSLEVEKEKLVSATWRSFAGKRIPMSPVQQEQ